MTHLIAQTQQLLIGYEVQGPVGGPPLLLLHGWPDDVRTWDAVATPLASAGWRTVAPYLRGFGPTRFWDSSVPRTAQPTAMAQDAIDLLDSLELERVTVVGHDWGARIAYTLAALWPERVERLITLANIYETGMTPGSQLNYSQQQAFWYQWFFGSERGREALQDNSRELCQYLWKTWSPAWDFTPEEFARTAASWDNPDWVEITLHSYRVRWGNAPIDPQWVEKEERLKEHPPIFAPTIHFQGEIDGAVLADALKDQSASYVGPYRSHILPGVGHFIQRERPEVVLDTLLS